MKKFLFALLLPLLSAALFAQQEGEVEKAFTQEEIDYFYTEWLNDKEDAMFIAVEILKYFPKNIRQNNDIPEPIEFLYEVIIDDIEVFNSLIREGVFLSLNAVLQMGILGVVEADSLLTKEEKLNCLEMIYNYIDSQRELPYFLVDRNFKDIF